MVLTIFAKTKRGLFLSFLFFFVLGGVGCSAEDREEYLNKLMERFSFGAARYLNDIESKNLMVRKNAIYYLGEKRVEKAVPLLINFLGPNEPKTIQRNAIIALGKIKQASSADPLIRLLQEGDDELRCEVIWALSQIKDPKAIRPLAGLLNDRKTRLTAIWAMGQIGDKSAVPLLTELLAHENKFVRHNAAQSLKKIGKID